MFICILDNYGGGYLDLTLVHSWEMITVSKAIIINGMIGNFVEWHANLKYFANKLLKLQNKEIDIK